jgi:hypothetical protein
MQRVLKNTIIIFIAVSVLAVPFSAFAAEDLNVKKEISAGAMAADTLTLRPLGVISLVAGFGLFVISSPFSAAGGNIGKAWNAMVTKPAKFTFARPLGEF